MPWQQSPFSPQAHTTSGLGLSYLLQGLQHSLAVHLQDVQFGLIFHPPIRHHCHQVEADVMVWLPAAGTADISCQLAVESVSRSKGGSRLQEAFPPKLSQRHAG